MCHRSRQIQAQVRIGQSNGGFGSTEKSNTIPSRQGLSIKFLAKHLMDGKYQQTLSPLMTSAPRLLDQIASLTAIRDMELIEFSLLKTLQGFLHPCSLSMVRLNNKGKPLMEIVYGSGKCQVTSEDVSLSEDFLMANNYLTETNTQSFSTTVPEGVLYVFTLTHTRYGRSHLQLTLAAELSKADAHMVNGVLQIYRNFVGVMQHAQTDQLTGLANRKTFEDCVARVHELIPTEAEPVSIERRGKAPLQYWLVMVDIDHFKSVNDKFGHLYGDEVLVILAQLMQVSFRDDDMIFRFGGEEFVLIIRCADLASCHTVLERFRMRVEHRVIPQVGNITVSMGATRMDSTTFSATIVDHADQALYYSKRNGRNQIAYFEDLVSKGLLVIEKIQTDEISFF